MNNKGAELLVDYSRVREIVEKRTVSSVEKTINHLIEKKGILLNEDCLGQIYDSVSRFSNHLTDIIVANNLNNVSRSTSHELSGLYM